MSQRNDPPAKPLDATQATDEQREEEEQLDDQHGDPDGPGIHQSRHDIADET